MPRHPLRFLAVFLLLIGMVSYGMWIGIIGRPIPFETLAKDTEYPGGIPSDDPTIVVMSSPQDADVLINTIFGSVPDALPSYPQFVHGLRDTDYQQFFVLLVLQGAEGPYANVEIQRVAALGNQIAVHTRFTPSGGRGGPAITVSPYHLIAVRKDGLRGPNIHFRLTNGWFVLADTTHDVP